jgi:hypothetical protein
MGGLPVYKKNADFEKNATLPASAKYNEDDKVTSMIMMMVSRSAYRDNDDNDASDQRGEGKERRPVCIKVTGQQSPNTFHSEWTNMLDPVLAFRQRRQY